MKPPEISPDRSRSPEIQKLIAWAWNYAAVEFGELMRANVPGAARGAWGGSPGVGYPPMDALIAIVEQLAIAHQHDAEVIRAKIKNRVDVAIAEARKKNDAQFCTPARMWNASSFAIAVDLDPRKSAAAASDGRPVRMAFRDQWPEPPAASGGKP